MGVFNFVKLHSVKFNKDWGWYLLVDDVLQLMLWYDAARVGEDIAHNIVDTISSKEMNYEFTPADQEKDSNLYNPSAVEQARFAYGHCRNHHGCLIRAHIARVGKVDLKELAAYMNDAMFEQKAELLKEGYRLLINKNGGYMFLNDSYTVTETCSSDIYMFPEPEDKNIQITQWPNGTHYYASVNGARVEVGGKEKWDTYDLAKQAARKFIRRHK